MDYPISEDEFNSIASCADHIDLITSLCTYIPAGHHAITIAGLDSFLTAQNKVLRATLKAVEERQESQRKAAPNTAASERSNSAPPAISPELLVRIMDACSGAAQDDEAIMQIHGDLYDATVMHGHGEPLKAFYAALHRQGVGVKTIFGNGVSQTIITRSTRKKALQPTKAPRVAARKRDRLVAA